MTTTSYDAAGRTVGSELSSSVPGVAVAASATVYDPATGLVVKTQAVSGGAVLSQVVRGFDSLGQQVSYTDSLGQQSTTSYDLLGRPSVTDDGKATQTRSYATEGAGSDPRGLLTSLTDSQAGTWLVGYDANGAATSVGYPGGLTALTTVDATASATALRYTLAGGSGCGSNCELYGEDVIEDVHGQQVRRTSSNSSGQDFSYDQAGRLRAVQDQLGISCTTRSYFFDNTTAAGRDSNRTGQASSVGAEQAPCPAVATSPTGTHSYDAASRLTDPGLSYDQLGRTTVVPAVGSVTGQGVTVGFYTNDLARQLTSTLAGAAVASTYTLDTQPDRYRSIVNTGGPNAGTEDRHYDDDGDSPSWNTIAGGAAGSYSRSVIGPTGGLVATITNNATTSSVAVALSNLHGDIIATTTTTPATDGLQKSSDSTEYGATRDNTTSQRYGWLGSKQRAADTPGGLVLMGVRLYSPVLGRFLQTDPVPGGSANAYDYVYQDPINNYDLDGRCWGGGDYCHPWKKIKQSAGWAGNQWQHHSIVRWAVGVGVVAGAAAACGLTWGIACAAAAGAAYGVLKYQYTRKRHSAGGYAGAAAWGGASGAAGAGGKLFTARWAGNAFRVGWPWHGYWARAAISNLRAGWLSW